MRYFVPFLLAIACDTGIDYARATPIPDHRCDSKLLSRKQVTVHNCDSAGEALAEAESSNPGWTAYNARNAGGRTWVVSMKQN